MKPNVCMLTKEGILEEGIARAPKAGTGSRCVCKVSWGATARGQQAVWRAVSGSVKAEGAPAQPRWMRPC